MDQGRAYEVLGRAASTRQVRVGGHREGLRHHQEHDPGHQPRPEALLASVEEWRQAAQGLEHL
ncbi:hypothetical protein QJS04_geneDACA020952 [Acorus gramineus]|uniref:MHC class I antigen n=1 Tax=Acorus gramineus TaxID=55184 RepID=A0AAV9B1Z7_ACOGR|nr:hypothetical protein QJS04_geneDACA020952 [Acorus gramineus]